MTQRELTNRQGQLLLPGASADARTAGTGPVIVEGTAEQPTRETSSAGQEGKGKGKGRNRRGRGNGGVSPEVAAILESNTRIVEAVVTALGQRAQGGSAVRDVLEFLQKGLEGINMAELLERVGKGDADAIQELRGKMRMGATAAQYEGAETSYTDEPHNGRFDTDTIYAEGPTEHPVDDERVVEDVDPRDTAAQAFLKQMGLKVEQGDDGIQVVELAEEEDPFDAKWRAAGFRTVYQELGGERKLVGMERIEEGEESEVSGQSGTDKQPGGKRKKKEKELSPEEQAQAEYRAQVDALLATNENPVVLYLSPVGHPETVFYRVLPQGTPLTLKAYGEYVGASEGPALAKAMEKVQARLDSRKLSLVISPDGQGYEKQWLRDGEKAVGDYRRPRSSEKVVLALQASMRAEDEARKAAAAEARARQSQPALQHVELNLHDRTLRIVQEVVKATEPKKSRWLGARTWNRFFNKLRPDHSWMSHVISDFNEAKSKKANLPGTGVQFWIKAANVAYYPAWALTVAPVGLLFTGGAYVLDGAGRGLARGLHELASGLERLLEGPDRWLDGLALSRLAQDGYVITRRSEGTTQTEQSAGAKKVERFEDLLVPAPKPVVRTEAAAQTEAEVAPAAESTRTRRGGIREQASAAAAMRASVEAQLDAYEAEEGIAPAAQTATSAGNAIADAGITREQLLAAGVIPGYVPATEQVDASAQA